MLCMLCMRFIVYAQRSLFSRERLNGFGISTPQIFFIVVNRDQITWSTKINFDFHNVRVYNSDIACMPGQTQFYK